MTKIELKFVAMFLDELSERFGNDGCNDFELPNTPENRELLISSINYGYGEDAEEVVADLHKQKGKTLYTVNFNLCDYLSFLVKKEAE